MSAHPSIAKVVKLDNETCERLAHLAELKQRTTHWLMKEAISQYLEQQERVEEMNRETLARWEEVQQAKVVSHPSVTAWLDTWGTDDEGSRPECGK